LNLENRRDCWMLEAGQVAPSSLSKKIFFFLFLVRVTYKYTEHLLPFSPIRLNQAAARADPPRLIVAAVTVGSADAAGDVGLLLSALLSTVLFSTVIAPFQLRLCALVAVTGLLLLLAPGAGLVREELCGHGLRVLWLLECHFVPTRAAREDLPLTTAVTAPEGLDLESRVHGFFYSQSSVV
jgi:hypothetical protein